MMNENAGCRSLMMKVAMTVELHRLHQLSASFVDSVLALSAGPKCLRVCAARRLQSNGKRDGSNTQLVATTIDYASKAGECAFFVTNAHFVTGIQMY